MQRASIQYSTFGIPIARSFINASYKLVETRSLFRSQNIIFVNRTLLSACAEAKSSRPHDCLNLMDLKTDHSNDADVSQLDRCFLQVYESAW